MVEEETKKNALNRGNCVPQEYDKIMIMYNFSHNKTSNMTKFWFQNYMKPREKVIFSL